VKNRRSARFVVRIVWVMAVAFSMSPIARGQSGPPASTPPSPQPAQQQDTVGEAARKAKAKKAQAQPKKVYTEEDLSGMRGTVSVVGQAGSGATASTPPRESSADQKSDESSKTANKQEAYWRGRAREIRDRMDALDRTIDKLREDIKKSGGSGFDASSGLKQNVIYVTDRNAQLKELEQKKEALQKQMDQLEEEGRKAGALPSWFR
jgi:chromosome segregation ATPase